MRENTEQQSAPTSPGTSRTPAGGYESTSYIDHAARAGANLRILDRESRLRKAEKILAVVRDYAAGQGMELGAARILDIGCSAGLITERLTSSFGYVVGLDADRKAIGMASENFGGRRNLAFQLGSAVRIPVRDGSFDVVICNHVYEHVSDSGRLFDEVHRVLRPGGFCYLAAPNKFQILEPHYRLPFLSWLPRSLADLYMRMTGRGDSYPERHLSHSRLLEKLAKFSVVDYTLTSIRDPERFRLTDVIRPGSWPTLLPEVWLRRFLPLIPTYLMILQKKEAEILAPPTVV